MPTILSKIKEDNDRLRFHLTFCTLVSFLLSSAFNLFSTLATHDLIMSVATVSLGVVSYLWLRIKPNSKNAIHVGFYVSILHLAFLIRCAAFFLIQIDDKFFAADITVGIIGYILTSCWWLTKVYHK
ncbi:conserved membrane hypothetical protein [Vibrio chagasii]|nr:conserved membrane hypothetical protein [Vibrio chagasii]CAH7221491.1 conserved membrane hypothetical protein [Vibrio chagasii]